MKFTVITVTYNSGDKLISTIENVLKQTYDDVELLIKDGMSKDDSIDRLMALAKGYKGSKTIRIEQSADKGIYDAMNQAVGMALGDVVIFMNCGDYFYSDDVLHNVAKAIEFAPDRGIYYGDAYFRQADQIMSMPKEITESICYRHIPNHQSCLFERRLFNNGAFNLEYKIRADYDFFLRQYFTKNVRPYYMGITVADYEGGGYSESKENRKKDKQEHEKITTEYMGEKRVKHYKTMMALTLQPLRRYIAQDSPLSGLYNSIKKRHYS